MPLLQSTATDHSLSNPPTMMTRLGVQGETSHDLGGASGQRPMSSGRARNYTGVS